MQLSIFVLIPLACFSVSLVHQKPQQPPAPGYRLIATSDTSPAFWVSAEAAEALASTRLHFMDLTDHQVADPLVAPRASDLPVRPTHQDVVRPLLSQVDGERYSSLLTTLSAFRNRYYTSQFGVQSAAWIFDQVRSIAGNRTDIAVKYFEHTWQQPSVFARIEGTSADDIVIIGAHQDSTAGGMPSGSAPGADDDGSGSTGVLEVFRIIVGSNFRPQHPIEFHWYAAEEVGLRGSQAIAQSYQNQGVTVRTMLQFDMIGYDVREQVIGIITDYVDPTTTAFNRLLVDEYLNLPWRNTACGYACSDHASWNRFGYRSSFPFEGQFSNSNPYIHSTSDTMAWISVDHALEFVKLGVSFVVEFSYVDSK